MESVILLNSSSSSSGYSGSAITTPTTPMGSYDSRSLSTPTPTTASTVPTITATTALPHQHHQLQQLQQPDVNIPVATVAAVTPYYSEALNAMETSQKSTHPQQQQHLQQQQQRNQYFQPYAANCNYATLYESGLDGFGGRSYEAPTNNLMERASINLRRHSVCLAATPATTPTANVNLNLNFNLNNNHHHQSNNNIINNNHLEAKAHVPYNMPTSSSTFLHSTTTTNNNNFNANMVNTTKPQAAATPFFATPTANYYDGNYKYKYAYNTTPTYQAPPYYGTPKPTPTYATDVTALRQNVLYDKYVPAANNKYNMSFDPLQDVYTRHKTNNNINNSSSGNNNNAAWPWSMEMPPANNYHNMQKRLATPTAAIAPTNKINDNFYAKYSGPSYYAPNNAVNAAHTAMWPNQPYMERLPPYQQPLPPPPPPTIYHNNPYAAQLNNSQQRCNYAPPLSSQQQQQQQQYCYASPRAAPKKLPTDFQYDAPMVYEANSYNYAGNNLQPKINSNSYYNDLNSGGNNFDPNNSQYQPQFGNNQPLYAEQSSNYEPYYYQQAAPQQQQPQQQSYILENTELQNYNSSHTDFNSAAAAVKVESVLELPSNKNLSIRDFLSSWNDDEEDFNVVAAEEFCFMDTDKNLPVGSEALSLSLEADTSQYTNLPDIVIDITKSTTNNNSTNPVEELKETNGQLEFSNFDVEKELDELQAKHAVIIGEKSLCSVENNDAFSKCLERADFNADIEANLRKVAEKLTAQIQEGKLIEETTSNVELVQERSAFEKEYKTFIHKIDCDQVDNKVRKRKSSKSKLLKEEEVEEKKKITNFSKFHKRKRKVVAEETAKIKRVTLAAHLQDKQLLRSLREQRRMRLRHYYKTLKILRGSGRCEKLKKKLKAWFLLRKQKKNKQKEREGNEKKPSEKRKLSSRISEDSEECYGFSSGEEMENLRVLKRISQHIIPKLSDLCAQKLQQTERVLSVEEALAEMYRNVGVFSDSEENSATAETDEVFIINLQEILDGESDLYVLQCDVNENILSSANSSNNNNSASDTLQLAAMTEEEVKSSDDDSPVEYDLTPIPSIHHEEIVPDNYVKYKKENFLKYLHNKYVQNHITKFHCAHRILKKYKRQLLRTLIKA